MSVDHRGHGDFEIHYEIRDICGDFKPIPLTIRVYASVDIPDGADEQDLRSIYRNMVQDNFADTIAAVGLDQDAFVAFGKAVVARRKEG